MNRPYSYTATVEVTFTEYDRIPASSYISNRVFSGTVYADNTTDAAELAWNCIVIAADEIEGECQREDIVRLTIQRQFTTSTSADTGFDDLSKLIDQADNPFHDASDIKVKIF